MIDGEIENWYVSAGHVTGYVICGRLTHDNKGRFADMSNIRTSTVKSIDFETGIVKTRNSTYQLVGNLFK